MIDQTVDVNIESLLPKSKTLPSFYALKLSPDLVIVVKTDGEFSLVHYERNGECYTVNKWGRKRREFNALNELVEAMRKQDMIEEAEFKAEMYAVDGAGCMLQLPKFIHLAKGKKDFSRIRLGLFNLISVNGRPVHETYAWKLEEMKGWFKDCRLVSPLPFKRPQSHKEIADFWSFWVEQMKFEGLVARSNSEIWKVKPVSEVDAVIVGINKRKKLKDGEVTSIKLALMPDEETFLELSDCASGISHDLRRKLYAVMEKYRVKEDRDTILIKPFIVVQVEYTDTFRDSRNRCWKYVNGRFVAMRDRRFVKLRHPRLMRFRADKTASPLDLRLEQIPTP